MQESSLHKALKDIYTHTGDRQEVEIDGFYIDVVSRQQLIEIQTSNFSSLKTKLSSLLHRYQIRIVYPIAKEKVIIKLPAKGGNPVSRRKSPKRGRLEDLFSQLVYIPQFVKSKNFTLEILLTQQEEIRRDDGLGSWRRKGVSVFDHRLISIFSRTVFSSVNDYNQFFPLTLPETFTTRDFSELLSIRRRLAGKMVYTFRELGLIANMGKRGNARLYRRSES